MTQSDAFRSKSGSNSRQTGDEKQQVRSAHRSTQSAGAATRRLFKVNLNMLRFDHAIGLDRVDVHVVLRLGNGLARRWHVTLGLIRFDRY